MDYETLIDSILLRLQPISTEPEIIIFREKLTLIKEILHQNTTQTNILKILLINGYLPLIRKSKDVTSEQIEDAMCIDNLHDFYFNEYDISSNIQDESLRIKRIDLNKSIKNLIQNSMKDNEIKQDINRSANVNQKAKKKRIFKIYDMFYSNINKEKNILGLKCELSTLLINNLYFETPGKYFFDIMTNQNDGYVCPYKNALDPGNISCDTVETRNNMVITIPNFEVNGVKNIITVTCIEKKVQLSFSHDFDSYIQFFTSNNDVNKTLEHVYIGENTYILKNEKNQILKYLIDNLSTCDYDLMTENDRKLLVAGLHLKRMGDYFQIEYFNNSEYESLTTDDSFIMLRIHLLKKLNKTYFYQSSLITQFYNINHQMYDLYLYNVSSERVVDLMETIIMTYKNNLMIGGGDEIEDIYNYPLLCCIYYFNAKKKK